MRDPQNRTKSYTGTVHFAHANGRPACSPVRTHAGWLLPTIEDVTCLRCIAIFGADEPTDLRDPAPARDPHVVRREQERAARRRARNA